MAHAGKMEIFIHSGMSANWLEPFKEQLGNIKSLKYFHTILSSNKTTGISSNEIQNASNRKMHRKIVFIMFPFIIVKTWKQTKWSTMAGDW